jgi:hypothetical protein
MAGIIGVILSATPEEAIKEQESENRRHGVEEL